MQPRGTTSTTAETSTVVSVVVHTTRPPVLPTSDEVRVVAVRVDSADVPVENWFACLTDEERTRAMRYRPEAAKLQFVIGRGLLRKWLGESLGVAPTEVRIGYTASGKPILKDAEGGLHFNVSHSHGLAVIAVARESVGIDIERIRELENRDALVRRFFSAAESEAYLEVGEVLRPAAFFRGWTSKEAVIKSAGLTVACLVDFDVELHPARPAALLAARIPALQTPARRLVAWEIAPGFTAAIALEGERALQLKMDG